MKSMMILVLALAFSITAVAAEKKGAGAAKKSYSREYGMAGCGLGAVVMGKHGGQIFAATTNGTFYNQTFGITFGTLNCDDSDRMEEVASRMDNYVVANKGALASDIARGEGETLAGLAKIMNCSDPSKLSSALQSNFKQIFPTHTVVPNVVTDEIITTVVGDEALAVTCKLES